MIHSQPLTLRDLEHRLEICVSIKHLLRTLAVCLPLMFGSLSGVPMKPEEIEELMHNLNQPKITITIPGESENGDQPMDDPVIPED